MTRTILLSGATGLIGKHIVPLLIAADYNPVILSRSTARSKKIFPQIQTHVEWSSKSNEQLQEVINGSHAVINLAGESIGAKRWSQEQKKKILQSRLNSTNAIVECILKSDSPPQVLINASAIGYYGISGDELRTEESTFGSDFLAQVCVEWEKAALRASSVCHVVSPRTGVVLDAKDGALAKMLPLFRTFLGGALRTASGRRR